MFTGMYSPCSRQGQHLWSWPYSDRARHSKATLCLLKSCSVSDHTQSTKAFESYSLSLQIMQCSWHTRSTKAFESYSLSPQIMQCSWPYPDRPRHSKVILCLLKSCRVPGHIQIDRGIRKLYFVSSNHAESLAISRSTEAFESYTLSPQIMQSPWPYPDRPRHSKVTLC